MRRVEASQTISAPPETVFAFVADLANLPRWQSGIVSAEQTSPDPVGVGSTAHVVRELLGQRLAVDLKYFLTSTVGAGIGYSYDKLSITDFNTIDTNGPVGFYDATGVPRIDWLGGLMTGYGNRPYEGHRVFARVLYRF